MRGLYATKMQLPCHVHALVTTPASLDNAQRAVGFKCMAAEPCAAQQQGLCCNDWSI